MKNNFFLNILELLFIFIYFLKGKTIIYYSKYYQNIFFSLYSNIKDLFENIFKNNTKKTIFENSFQRV